MLRPWRSILFLWLIGVLAAAQLAKFSVIAPLLRDRFGLSLSETGLLISLLEVGGGLLGFVAGLALGWTSCRRLLLAGMVIMTAASLLEACAVRPALMFSARAFEGLGYLLVVIAAPTAIAAVADDRSRARALALWSTFVPVGIALGSAVTGAATAVLDVRGTMLLWSAVLAASIWPLLHLRIDGGEGRSIVLPRAAAWVSTLSFGIYTLFLCALTMLLPTFLITQKAATLDEAGLAASIASLSALPASGLAILFLKRGMSGRRLLAIAVPTLAASALLVPLGLGSSAGLVPSTAIIIGAVVLSGIVSPLMFARLPILAGAEGPHDPRIAAANGLITQFGAGGALVGPPLGGFIADVWGWAALGTAIGALTLLMLGGLAVSERLAARPA